LPSAWWPLYPRRPSPPQGGSFIRVPVATNRRQPHHHAGVSKQGANLVGEQIQLSFLNIDSQAFWRQWKL
jgi:hypothetical protein